MDNSGGLKIQTRQLDDATVIIELNGEMDIYTTARVKELMAQLLEKGCRNLIINLHHVDYLDSTGLGMLIGTLRRAREYGGCLRLVAPRSHVRRLLEITHLTFAFPIDATEQEAADLIHNTKTG